MQQETQSVSSPAPEAPPAPPVPPTPQQEQRDAFYQPAQPAPYAAPAEEHATPLPYTPPAANASTPDVVSWEASEYVHTDKGGLWLLGFGAIVAVMLGIALWLQAWTFAALILVMAVAMGVFAFRPPRVLHYTLNDNGVHIDQKTFNYSDFRAFGILEDGAFFTMTLIPIKRFAPALSVYFAEDHGEQIVDIVGAHLPMEHLEPDVIDKIMRRLRF